MNTKSPSSRGFTIVELLIVIVVIGILAAITIVAYNGIQNRANDAAVSSDLASISKKITAFSIDNDRYPKGGADLATLGLRLSTNAYSRGMWNGTSYYNVVYCWPNAANPYDFALVAQSKSGTVFEAKGGAVSKASYGLQGSMATCQSAGVTMDSGNDRDWFYNNDAWFSWAKG